MLVKKKLFFLEALGEITSAVGMYLISYRENTLSSICKALKIKKRDVQKALSLLIHFEVVLFNTYKENIVRYFVKEKCTDMVDIVVYLEYIEKQYGVEGFHLCTEIFIRKKIKGKDIPDKYISVCNKMIKDAVVVEKEVESKETKREKKEEKAFAEKELCLEKNRVKQRIIDQILEKEVERIFNPHTRTIFSIILSFHPRAATFFQIIQKATLFGIEKSTGIVAGTDMLGGSTAAVEKAVKEHLNYLSAFGAIIESVERYQINYSWFIGNVKINRIVEYYRLSMGECAGLVLATLLSKKYIEDKFIQKHVLLEIGQSKEALFSLLEEEAVSMQMIPRSAECISSKSFHLWHAKPEITIFNTKAKVFERINMCYLDITKCRKSKHFLNSAEYNSKLDMLYSTLEQLHLFHFILGI